MLVARTLNILGLFTLRYLSTILYFTCGPVMRTEGRCSSFNFISSSQLPTLPVPVLGAWLPFKSLVTFNVSLCLLHCPVQWYIVGHCRLYTFPLDYVRTYLAYLFLRTVFVILFTNIVLLCLH